MAYLSPPFFYFGYRPNIATAVSKHAEAMSDESDIMQIGPEIKIGDVRNAISFLARAAQSTRSKMKTLIVNMEQPQPKSQEALLRLIEEPLGSCVILYKSSTQGVRNTILSRCILIDKKPSDYGSRLQALAQDGIPFGRAAEIAAMADEGIPIELIPDPQEKRNAEAVWQAMKKHSLDNAMSILKYGVSDGMMTALRKIFLKEKEYRLLLVTYGEGSNRSKVEICMAHALRRSR